MAKEPRKPAERITEFKSLASYTASTAREGDTDAPIFEGVPIRRVVRGGAPWFSVIDMILALTESDNPSSYWGKLKERMSEEGAAELLTRCQKLPLPGKDGKLYPGDCADIETLNRLVQSIPSPKVEPWKQWLAKVGYERIQETAQPSRAIERAIAGFRKLGRDERWIEDRIKSIVGANEKTDQWKVRGVEGKLYAALNAEMSEVAFGVTPAEHCEIKHLPKGENRQDHMTRTELAINNLADTAATDIMIARDTRQYPETRRASLDGAGVARVAREALERQTGKPVVSKDNFLPKTPTGELLPTAKKPRKKES